MKKLILCALIAGATLPAMANTIDQAPVETTVQAGIDHYATVADFIRSAYLTPVTGLTGTRSASNPNLFNFSGTVSGVTHTGYVVRNPSTGEASLYDGGTFIKSGIVDDDLDGF